MKKTVLFLMNGFGIEQLNSYSIYNANLMPNLDSYTKKYLFSTIESNATDLSSGYRLFSTGSKIALTYSLIDNYYTKFSENKNLNYYLNTIKKEGKVHLFLFYDNEKSLEHIKYFCEYIKTKNDKIYLHLILTSNNIDNYKDIEKFINKVTYDFKQIKIGIIVGINVISSINLNSFMNMFQNEIGEKWKEISKKISSLNASKIKPNNVKEFYMNEGFKFDINDSLFFFNYSYFDISNFIANISKINNVFDYCSLFQLNGVKYPMFSYPSSGISMNNSLKKIEAKSLFLANSKDIRFINYYCNGLKNLISENVCFTKTDDGINNNFLKSVIRDSNYDLIIINYQIDNVNTVSELTDKLGKLDSMLKVVHDICLELEVSLFISSLYGMQKELMIDNFSKVMVDFSLKVPVIVIDQIFNKKNYILGFGNTYTLANTIYTNINPKIDEEVLIKRKGIISKFLKK